MRREEKRDRQKLWKWVRKRIKRETDLDGGRNTETFSIKKKRRKKEIQHEEEMKNERKH